MAADADTTISMDQKVHDWLTANLGPVIALERQPRWRPGWDATVTRDGNPLRLYIRGPRGDSYVSPVDMYQEAQIHHAFEASGIPAPRVFGMIEDPLSIVMERLPGRINTDAIEDSGVRQKVRDDFIRIVADVHNLPLETFEKVGLEIPKTPDEIAGATYRLSETIFERQMPRPFPLMRFIGLWLRRNTPQDRTRIAFVNFDAGQFLFDGDRVTGLIDFEVSGLGDPAGELAGMRLRDTSEPLGDLSAMIDRYEALTGDRISKRLIEYHTAAFCGVNGFLMWPLAFNTTMEQDYTAYMQYMVATTRWSITAIAAHIGMEFSEPREPRLAPLGYVRAANHLIEQIGMMPGGSLADEYARDSAAGLARYLSRWNDYGRDVLAENLADASALLGRTLDDWDEAQAAVEAYVLAAPPEEDQKLVQHFHNWLRRQAFLLQGCGVAAPFADLDLQVIPER